MRTILFLLLCGLLCGLPLTGQTWQLPQDQIDLGNQPASVSLSDMIGVNVNKAFGQVPQPYRGVIRNARSFHLMDNDFITVAQGGSAGKGKLMADGIPQANTCDCSNVFACSTNDCQMFDPSSGKSAFPVKDWYCKWRNKDDFSTTYASLEAIFPLSATNCDNFVARTARSYPNKFFTVQEMGGSQLRQNAEAYAIEFLTTFCPTDESRPCLVNVLELGNEPWGSIPGVSGFLEFSDGVVDGFKAYYGNNPASWRCKISTAAVVASNIEPGCNFDDDRQSANVMISPANYPYISYLSIHNYAFPHNGNNVSNCLDINQSPESTSGMYLTLKNLTAWRNDNIPGAQVNITEFGWPANNSANPGSSVNLGETRQNAYVMRAYLLANRYDINKAFYYNFFDTNEQQFANSGLFNGAFNQPREIVEALVKLDSGPLADKRFLKALTENNTGNSGQFTYVYGNQAGQPTHLVTWKPEQYSGQNPSPPTVNGQYSSINLPGTLTAAAGTGYFYLNNNTNSDGTIGGSGSSARVRNQNGTLQVKLSGMPVVIPIDGTGCQYSAGGVLNCGGTTCNPSGGGTTESGCGLTVSVSGQVITLTNTPAGSNSTIVKVRTASWSESYEFCNGYSGNPETCSAGASLTVPNSGTYVIDVQGPNGRCGFTVQLPGDGSDGNGPVDDDNDGVCSDIDCDDNDPTVGLPQTPGTSCNDGNPATTNDVIQADQCTCQGTTSPGCGGGGGGSTVSGCTATFGLSGQTVTLQSGPSSPQSAIIRLRTPNWTEVYSICNGYSNNPACVAGSSATATGTGIYVIDVQQGGSNCTVNITLPASGGGNTTVDQDGDNVCSDVDCDDNDPTVGAPQTPGTACNDNNPATNNDVILPDGCTCEGTGGGGQTTVSGCSVTVAISGSTVSFVSKTTNNPLIIKVRRANWSESRDLCNDYGSGCTASQSVTVAGTGAYVVDVQGAPGGNCTFNINIGGGGNRSAFVNPSLYAAGELTVFPNPVAESVSVRGVELSTIRSARVTNVAGKILFEQTTDLGRIDLASLPAGVYRMLFDVDGNLIHRMVVKR